MLTIALYDAPVLPHTQPERIVATTTVGLSLDEPACVTLHHQVVLGRTSVTEAATHVLNSLNTRGIPAPDLEGHRPRIEEAITHLRAQEHQTP